MPREQRQEKRGKEQNRKRVFTYLLTDKDDSKETTDFGYEFLILHHEVNRGGGGIVDSEVHC